MKVHKRWPWRRVTQGADTSSRGTGRGASVGAVTGSSKAKNPTTGLWVKRNTASGRFVEVKKSGDVFKGVRSEN